MRSLLRALPRQPLISASRSAAVARPFSASYLLRLKEDADRSPEEVEKSKEAAMKDSKHKRGVTSASEEVVGADQEKVQDHGKHMEDLQKQTAQESQKEKEGKS